ncbi:DUF6344 domain-containing protein [Streptomyces paludis]|uniref:Uncharacterized protein n=1 Tax=Streptomyces paludis TaxID=2282738 RepID=A0A345HQF2_9ACTN|nr:DUF6344 domain-containing protein [Streptomyces paludis]AXG78926.1 hypothetical protein DVK44_15840 [Streptomyces paludis]
MAALKVKKLWTVFLTAFFAVLASLGLTAPATAAGAAAQQPADQPAGRPAQAPAAAARHSAEPGTARWAAVPRALPRDRSLPPTIKQRIRAEAHGSSPSVRHLPAAAPSETDAALARENAYAADAALVAAAA